MITLSPPLTAQIQAAVDQITSGMVEASLTLAREERARPRSPVALAAPRSLTLAREERARVATLVLSFARGGKKPHIIARSLGLSERHVIRILDAHRLLGIDTGAAAPGRQA